MQDYQTAFLEFVIRHRILMFGEFTLKSGRTSPYFFNAGLFDTGAKLAFLAKSYAAAIVHAGVSFDMLFGPAYKGIPLVSATAAALAEQHGLDKPYCFNRKEAKEHGEGGLMVGAEPDGKVLIIDDVITAGTAIGEAVALLGRHDTRPGAVVVAMDRQERGAGELSAIQEIQQAHGLEIISIINLQAVIDYLGASGDPALAQHLEAVNAYRARYGVQAD